VVNKEDCQHDETLTKQISNPHQGALTGAMLCFCTFQEKDMGLLKKKIAEFDKKKKIEE